MLDRSGLEKGGAYSALVKEAHSLGYTEPDPRDDLGTIMHYSHSMYPFN